MNRQHVDAMNKRAKGMDQPTPEEILPGTANTFTIPTRSVFRLHLHPLQVVGVVVPLLVWQVAGMLLARVNHQAAILLPTPWTIVTHDVPAMGTFYGIGIGGQYHGATSSYTLAFLTLALNSLITIGRLLVGTAIGLVAGIGIGLLLSATRVIRSLLEPSILIIRTVPLLALIPLFLTWFGGDEIGNILYVAFAVFSMLVVNTIEAVYNVPLVQRQYAQTLGATTLRMYRTVIIPAIIPELVGGIRVVIGLSWAIVLAAEYLAAQSGLGRIMILSEQYLFTGRMVVIAVLFMIYSVVLNALFVRWARYVTRWTPEAAVQAFSDATAGEQ